MAGKPPLFTAEPCDVSDPVPGVRLIRADSPGTQATRLGRLSPRDALRLAGDLIAASIAALADSHGSTS